MEYFQFKIYDNIFIMNPFNKFDKIFIINLDERKDRWSNVVKELQKMDIANYERFSAIKPMFNNIPSQYYNKLVSPHKYKVPYIIGSMGCKMSHYEIIKIAKQRNYSKILIFEDDISFKYDKEKTYELMNNVITRDWHMLYLSANHRSMPSLLDNDIYKVNEALCTHAYALHKNSFNYLLETMMNIGCEIDNYYIYAMQQNDKVKCRCVYPNILTQISSYSDVLNRDVNYENVIN